ncbi:MAG: ABC transporter permease [Acidobacteriota bacterium]
MRIPRAGMVLLAAVVAIGILAPCLAGDRPLVTVSSEGIRLPALRRLAILLPAGGPLPPRPAPSGDAWALFPPIAHDPLAIDLHSRLQSPGPDHWLGTDDLGRDILSRLIYSTRPSLLVALIATLLSLGLGVPIGAAAGYAGGWVDLLLSRLIEASLSFPVLILLLLLTGLALGGGSAGPTPSGPLRSLLIVGGAIGIARWGVIARYMRGELLRLADTDLEVAARAMGAVPLRILGRHLIPAGMTPVAVSAAFGAGSAVIAEASLSFLGMGIQPPAPTWGQMIAVSAQVGARYWWMLLFPGLMVAVLVGAFNMLAEGLRRSEG